MKLSIMYHRQGGPVVIAGRALRRGPAALLMCLVGAAGAAAQDARPADTYEWIGDCPGACCPYGKQWPIARATPAWAEPVGPEIRTRRDPPAFVIPAGAPVRAVTGTLQALERGRASMRRDFSADASYGSLSTRHRRTITLFAGEDVHLLASLGGRSWRIWHRGQVLDAHLYDVGDREACSQAACAGVVVKEPETRWWLMVIDPSRRVGWIEAAANAAPPCP